MESLQKALNDMPNYFSSNQFSRKAKRYGLTLRQVQSGVCAQFLHQNCIQMDTKRTWSKKQEHSEISRNVEYAINLLKSKGYKVLKPVTEYQEL